MGLLQEGKWVDRWYDTKSNKGRFKRKNAQFRNWITKDGSGGSSGEGGFKAVVLVELVRVEVEHQVCSGRHEHWHRIGAGRQMAIEGTKEVCLLCDAVVHLDEVVGHADVVEEALKVQTREGDDDEGT